MSHVEDLKKSLALLEEAHETTKTWLEQTMPEVDPHMVRDTAGRYILLDSLTAIVQGRSALVDWERVNSSVKIHYNPT